MAEQQTYDRLLGVTVGTYRLEQLLGQSQRGPTFLARSLENGTQCVMHFLAPPAELAAEARIVYLGLFQQEANRVAALRDPHILPVIDYGNYHGIPYLVQPHIASRTLRDQLAKHGPPDALTISRTLDQIAAALEYAHQHAVLHRNLSTNNILLDRRPLSERVQSGVAENTILVTDFGIMRMLELSRQNSQAMSASNGQVYRLYASSESIAPEQILGSSGIFPHTSGTPSGGEVIGEREPIDTYTDVYALGAVVYHMLTGHPIFSGSKREDILRQHVQAPIPPLEGAIQGAINRAPTSPDVQARMTRLLARAMAKDPAQRIQHPGELADAFHALVAPDEMARKAFAAAVPPSVQRAPVVGPAAPLAPIAPLATRQQFRSRRISRRNVLIVGGSTVAVAAIAILLGSHYLSGSTSPGVATGGTGTTVPTGAPTVSGSTPSGTGGTTPASGHTGTVIAHVADVPLNSAKTFPNGNNPNPGILVHLSNNRFVAFDSTCTHQGCPVAYAAQNKLLVCPCHQAEFDPANNAAVVQGPASTPLAAIPITVNADGTITTRG
jgi:serine/threonine protein kinase